MANRQAAIAVFLEGLEQILPGSKNTAYYQQYLNQLSDEQFEQLVVLIEQGKLILPLYQPNLSKPLLDVSRNIEIGKAWGHEFFEQLWLTDPIDPTVETLTPKKYLLLELPMRRQAQTLENKMAVPLSNEFIDDLSGQPMDSTESKGSALTFPELQVLNSEGLDSIALELLKFRGGDVEAYRALERTVIDNGSATMAQTDPGDSRVKSTDTLNVRLRAAHIQSNA